MLNYVVNKEIKKLLPFCVILRTVTTVKARTIK